MGFRDAERAQSIQIGAVLLFGLLIIALSSYQGFAVPDQNTEIEANQNQETQNQLQQLRDGVLAQADGGVGRTVEVTLGVTYPRRIIAVNAGPATGTLRTVGTTDPDVNVSVDNATATGESGDFWTGTEHTYTTGGLRYTPNYNYYENAPETVYENTVLFNTLRDRNRTVTGQALIDDDRITLVTLNGSLSTTRAGRVSVDIRAISASSRTISVTNVSAGGNVTLTLPTRLDEQTWDQLLADQLTNASGHVVDVRAEVIPDSPLRLLRVELESNVTYRLRMARVGVGSSTAGTGEAYVTPVSGVNETVPEGETSEVVVEVRDSYNNPVPDVLVNASTTRTDSNVDPRVDLSDDDGQVRLTYEADDDIDGEPKPDRINVSLTVDPPSRTAFDPDTAVNASVPVSIGNADGSGFGGGGGGVAYGIEWLNPDDPGYNPDANLSSCDPDSCLWDVSTSQDATLTLPGSTNPPVQNTTLNFAVNDTSVGTVRPGDAETGPAGEAPTELRARGNGTVRSFVTGQSGSDQLDVIVTNVTRLGLVYETDATAQPYPPSVSDARSRVDLNVTNSRDQSVELYGITINDSTTGAQIEDQNDGGSREVELDVDGDGTPEGDADPGSGFSVGTRIELDTNATLAANGDSGGEDTAHLRLNEFQEGSGTPVDMVGEEIEVTVHYTVGGERAADTFDVKTIQEGG